MTAVESERGGGGGAASVVYLDLTHLGRHVTGLERISIELFEKAHFRGADVRAVRARGVLTMILAQQILIPLLALLNPRARFVFPGFPPSPLMLFARGRVVLYVHDLFLVTRRQDLGTKARLYMALPFRLAVTRLKYFLANSEKTRRELMPFAPPDALVALYRPVVRNVFALAPQLDKAAPAGGALRLVALGTVEPRKNYRAALAILDALSAAGYPGATLDIIGREGWGDVTDDLKRHPRVRLLGYLPAEDARAVIEAADLYLCTSHDEGLGLPLVEVQFAGLPVVAPDAPVFREVLAGSGTFIDTGDAAAAARRIAALAADAAAMAAARRAAIDNAARWNRIAASDAARATRLFDGDGLDARFAASAREVGT